MKKKVTLFVLFISLLSIVGLTQSVSANSVNVETGTTVTVSEDTDGALAVSGQDIVIDGNVNGPLFVAGNTITIKGNVNGPIFVAGNSITIEGSIEGEVFTAGNIIRIDPGTELSRDAFMTGSEILINGTIGRDLFSGSNKIEINNTIARNAHLSSETITFTDDGAVGGDLYYQSANELVNADQYVEGQVNYDEINRMEDRQERPQQSLLRTLLNIIGTLISAIIIWWFLRRITQGWWFTVSQRNLRRPLILLLTGLGLLLLIPAAILLTFIISALTGLGLYLLAVSTLLLFILLLLLAKIVTATIIGKHLLENRFSLNKYNSLVSFLIAYLLLDLASTIPVIGGIVTFLSVIYALGLVFSEAFHRIRGNPLQPSL